MKKSPINFSLMCFVAGASLGALAALLYAPRSGEETRELIGKRAEEGRDYLAARGKAIRRDAQHFVKAGRRAVEDLMEEGKDVASRVLPV